MGLSLTSDEVVWALIDAADDHGCRLLDHDALAVTDLGDTAVKAARSALALATADGVDIDVVRVVVGPGDVPDEIPDDVVVRLRSMGFRSAEVVGPPGALDALQSFTPCLRAAIGAAAYPSRRACATPASAAPTRARRSLVAGVLGAAAAAVLSVLFVTNGSMPQNAHATPAVEATAAATESGWISVPVASTTGAQVTRKVVTAPPLQSAPASVAYDSAPASVAYDSAPASVAYDSAPASVPAAVAPLPEAAAAVAPAPELTAAVAPVSEAPTAATSQPHLDSTAPLAGPPPAVPADPAAPTAALEMTDLSNVFTALP